jgi:hypothetical protein
MDSFDLEFTELQLTINSIQCKLVFFELNEIRDKLNVVESLIRETDPSDFEEEFTPRKKRRTH